MGELIRTALALHLDQNRQILWSLRIPGLERLQQLKTLTRRVHSNRHTSTVFRWRLISVLTGVVSTRRQFVSSRSGESEFLAIGTLQRVCQGVEREVSGKRHGGNDIGRCDECVRSRVGIIAASEVAVVGGDDC